MAELIEMRPQSIHGLSALLHELLAGPERNRPGLLLCRFRLDEPHRRPQRRLDNRLGGVVLLPFQERLDVMRRDQPDVMPRAAPFPAPNDGRWCKPPSPRDMAAVAP